MALDERHVIAPAAAPDLAPLAHKPSFSVVIAAYQSADTIAEAINSVLEQTAPPLEIIVSDDGSTDALDAALRPFTDRITVLHNRHGGEAMAKNAGVRAAEGDFVVFLDSDDSYLPDRLAQLGELGRLRPDLDLLTTDAYVVAGESIVRRAYTSDWTFAADDQRRAILERNFIFGHVAVRRDLLQAAGGFDERIRRTTDWECWIRLILDGARAGAVLEPLANYRVLPSSLSAQRSLMHEGALQTLGLAARHPRLSTEERRVLERTIATRRRELSQSRLTEALRDPDGLRERAARILLSRHTPPRTRAKAALATLAPRSIARLAERRSGGGWTGAGGTRMG